MIQSAGLTSISTTAFITPQSAKKRIKLIVRSADERIAHRRGKRDLLFFSPLLNAIPR
jgi:hypothetical protein